MIDTHIDVVGWSFESAKEYLTKNNFSYIVEEIAVPENYIGDSYLEKFVVKQEKFGENVYKLLLCTKKGGVRNGI